MCIQYVAVSLSYDSFYVTYSNNIAGTLLNSEANLRDAVQNLSSHSNNTVKTKAESLYKSI